MAGGGVTCGSSGLDLHSREATIYLILHSAEESVFKLGDDVVPRATGYRHQ